MDTGQQGDPVDEGAASGVSGTAPAPTGLSVTTSDDDSVSLSWNAVTDAGVYKVEYRKRSSSIWLHHGYVYSGTSRTVTGLDCNTSYSFRVKARGDGNPYSLIYGSPSNIVSRTTSVCPSTPTTPTPTTPTSPTNLSLSVESGDDNDLDLAYTRSESPHYYQFELHRSTTQNGTYTRVDTEDDSTSPANFDDQTKGHWYKARGRNCATSARTGCGDWSAYSATILLPGSLEAPDPANTWATTLTSGYDRQSGEYGYWDGTDGYGSLSDSTFEYDGAIHEVMYIYWHRSGSSRQLEFRVDRCLKLSDFVSLRIDSKAFLNPNEARYTDAQCDANSALRQEFEFHDVTNNPLSVSGGRYLVKLTLSGSITDTVTVGDTQDPFVGQSVTMRASTSAAFGTASTYQWQEWSGTQWTNLSSAISSSHAVTSSTSGVRYFRVVVTNTSGKTEQSSLVAIEWKSMTVTVSSSPDYPESGTASKRRVKLTATVDAPSGVRYQWQQANGDNWTNLGVKSTSARRYVSSTSRGTKRFRVQVSHSVVPTVESEPVYVTWDEWEIVSDLLGELDDAVATSTAYQRAESNLVSCMNDKWTAGGQSGGAGGTSSTRPDPAVFSSFSGILNSYTGQVKELMEDTGSRGCGTKANTMFSTNESVTTSSLNALKNASSTYANWLNTPQGQAFEQYLADPDETRLLADLGSNLAATGTLEFPVYDPSSPSGKRNPTHSSEALEQGRGLNCLPNNIVGADLTLDNKLRVVSCLVFETSHSFWVAGGGSRQADTLRTLITTSSRYSWLGYGDWRCSDPPSPLPRTPQGPVLSCLKHDVAYDSLQRFDSAGPDYPLAAEADAAELDSAWNPRNKALADLKYKADIRKWGCQDQSGNDALVLCALPSGFYAEAPYFRAVARVNHKGWPVMDRDIAHIAAQPYFINCAEPVVPSVRDLEASRSGWWRITVTGTFARGCVPASLDNVWLGVDRRFSSGRPMTSKILSMRTECTVTGNDFDCSFINAVPASWISSISVYAIPREKEYGGSNYGRDDKRGRGVTVEF